jgi:putative colanic acid biosynthesis UDP-glucose lipid carrier transferase
LKIIDYDLPVGWLIYEIDTVFFVCLVIKRLSERWLIRLYREAGRNTRMVTLVGSDIELVNIYRKLVDDATLGYKVNGYYGDGNLTEAIEALEKEEGIDLSEMKKLERKGSIGDMLDAMARHEDLQLGDEVYVCLSRRERDVIKKLSRYCDYKVVRFYYVPVSVESIGLNLKRELLDDIEIYTTYENPLQSVGNRLLKRTFDIVMSLFFLIPTALMFPFIWLIIKIQSPGPIFFKQARTGIDGKTFYVLKFRSMHVNKDADKLQATKNDPRKYPFGNFMRKSNIDELPQFINILKGDMSFVGPRPHMLAHTEQYSALITKYMVRHFVKPGLTGWAQVTGFRGETKELWQMEGRVKRDIWYMEHWSIWLDIRIIWMTFKTIFVHDKNAY